ncbi:GEVED domain-containing protein [Chryseobacterium geocarposphaerae]|uniref:Putative secreted protein (Por secretion system target) n=1 Tax=Chryseobacterium geocarposphaerae TaxID=1416776 RepID=A0A2M9C6Z5_9FLAO|nr:GEVED domain-containing protein [Chryseobacterium geocarposphaerae]PJJ66608.1 putative secreted protein (Por secretion system target) [Chryseobacterium geocarposphaerae]
MTKIYLFFLAVLLSIQSFAQQYQVAGTCTMTLGTNTYGPMNSTTTSGATSRVAVIYPATQLTGVAGQALTGIYFKKMTTGNMTGTPNFKVYLKETSSLDFGAAAIDWATTITGATLVYDSNPVAASTGAAGWKQFIFSNNFTYSGAQNLMVLMEYTNTGNTVNTTWEYEYSSPCVVTTNNNTTKYINNTTGTLGTSLSSSNYRRPFISFSHVPAAPCTGTVTGGTAVSSVTNACANVPFNLSLTGATMGTGITYQWQSSPAGANTFTNIAGATSISYTVANQTAATDYRCIVTCTNGGSTQNSSVVAVGQNSGMACLNYCAAVSAGGTGTFINKVQFGTINNDSSASQPTASPYYTYYPAATTTVAMGTTQNISVTIGPAGTYTGAITSVWIDWNQDGTLSSTEHFYVGPGSGSAGIPSGTTLTVPVTIPVTAVAGITRMRIRTRGNGNPNLSTDACTSFGSGETEDYNITVAPGIPCSGSVTAGTASASAASICVGVPVSLTLTGATIGLGVTYQWQSSPAGANTFTNIAGATGISYTVASQTSATDYRCVVTCTNSGQSATSNTVSVGQNPVTQCYCTPTYTYGCSSGDNLNSFVITGAGTSTISDLNTGCNGSGYYDRTAAFTPVNLIAGQSYPVQINTTYTSPSYEKASIWIDFNDNGVFDAAEKLLTDLSLVTSPSFATANIAIPITAQAGVHRMRVRVVYSTTNVNACANASYGETHDYLVNVQPCTTPTPVVTVASITHNSASVNWSQDAIGANTYELRYRPVGSGSWLPAAGPIAVAALLPGALHSQPLTGLDPATLYEVEVVALCGTTNMGSYSHNEFTTKCDPTPPNVTITSITANSAMINWSPLAASATYEMRWRKVGDPWPTSMTPLPNPPANSYSLSPLDPYTEYEVQVRSTCVGSITPNPWSSLVRFTTERTCQIPPPGLTILELKPTSAKVQWDPYVGPDATGKYILRYRKVGIPGWTTVQVSNNIYILTDLLEMTKYEMEVANVCSGTPGNFTLPYYFTTPTVIYCHMGANTSSGEYISKVTVVPNGKPQMIKASAGSTYTDYTTDPLAQIELIQGSVNNQLTIDKVVSADAGVVAWIDFNRNGEFDINERILVSNPSTAATATTTFSVPSDAFVSNVDYMYVVMRVALMKGGIPVNCTNFDNGEVEDYTVRISKKPATNLLNQNDILIYPNPVSTVLNVKNISKRANYKIYSAAGQLISSGIILNNKVDVHALINGMYVIDIQDGSISAQKKFIKE